jgi:hypothetical protein
MRSGLKLIAIGMFFFFCGSAIAAAPALSLDYPRGGEVFTAGTTQLVRLGAKPKVTSALIELSIDGGVTFTTLGTITVVKKITPVLSFTVPNTPSGNCILRATGTVKTTPVVVLSAPFSIFSASTANGVGAGSVTTTAIAPGAVVTAGLADGSVTNPKLAAGAVTNDKVSSGSVSSNFVLTADGAGNANWAAVTVPDGSVTALKLAPSAVDLATSSVTGLLPLSKLSASFGDFFALMPADNAATVAVGADVSFPQDGPLSNISRSSASAFVLPDIGTYLVNFQVSVTEAGQLMATLNGTDLAYTVSGRATGTSQIVGTFLVTTTVINSTLTIRNPAGNSTALTITPLAGGTNSVSAHLVIVRLK